MVLDMKALGILIWNIFVVSVNAANKYRRICYYSSWAIYRPTSGKFSPSDIDPYLCTHIIYAFAKLNEETYVLETFDPWADLEDNYGLGGYTKVTSLRQQNPRLKIMISVGGWNAGSTAFSEMVSTRLKRKNFIESALRFLRKHNFDGLDINWEFPGVRGGREGDKENFSLLVQEFREAIDAEAPLSGKPKLLISAAVSASEKTVQAAYNPATLGKYLDFISIMTYDFHGSWDSNVQHHSPIYGRHRDTTSIAGFNMNLTEVPQACASRMLAVVAVRQSEEGFSVNAIKLWLSGGCPPDKIVVGMPFYGRSFTLTDAHMTAPGSPAVGGGEPGPFTREPGFLAYFEVCSLLMDSTWSIVIDPEERTPYAFKEDQWIGYDDIDSLIKKTVIVREWGLGGIMVWSVDMDDFRGLCGPQSYPLLRMMRKVLEFQPVRVVNLLPATPQALAHSFPAHMHPTVPPRLLASTTSITTPNTTPPVILKLERPTVTPVPDPIAQFPETPVVQLQAVLQPKTLFDDQARNLIPTQPKMIFDEQLRTGLSQQQSQQQAQQHQQILNFFDEQSRNAQLQPKILFEEQPRTLPPPLPPFQQAQQNIWSPLNDMSLTNRLLDIPPPVPARPGQSDLATADSNMNVNINNGLISLANNNGNNGMAQAMSNTANTGMVPFAGNNVASRQLVPFVNSVPASVPMDLRPVECPGEGFFRNPEDCTRFYRCVNMMGHWTVYHFFCPRGLVFDPNHAVCNWINMSPPCVQ